MKPNEPLSLYDPTQWLAASKGAFAYSVTTNGNGDARVAVTDAVPGAEAAKAAIPVTVSPSISPVSLLGKVAISV